jgi:hypothetical protein
MASRLDGIPVFELINTTVPAVEYNLVVRAIKRLGEPLYIPLAGLRRLELKLYHAHAQIILSQVQEFMERELERRIAELKTANSTKKIIPIKRD